MGAGGGLFAAGDRQCEVGGKPVLPQLPRPYGRNPWRRRGADARRAKKNRGVFARGGGLPRNKVPANRCRRLRGNWGKTTFPPSPAAHQASGPQPTTHCPLDYQRGISPSCPQGAGGGILEANDRAYPRPHMVAVFTPLSFRSAEWRKWSAARWLRWHPAWEAGAVDRLAPRLLPTPERHLQPARKERRRWNRSSEPDRDEMTWRACCPDVDGCVQESGNQAVSGGDPRLCVPASRQVCHYRRATCKCTPARCERRNGGTSNLSVTLAPTK